MERHQSFGFSFGEHRFKLDINFNSQGHKRASLSHSKDGALILPKQPLELLEFLVRHPGKPLTKEALLNKLSPGASLNTVDTYVSDLRAALIKYDPSKGGLIQTIARVGYRFLLPVEALGADEIVAYPVWNKARYYELIEGLSRDPDEQVDICIATTGLNQLDVRSLLRRGLRVRVLFINVANEALLHARYAVRRDKTTAKCIEELNEWLENLEALRLRYPKLEPKSEADNKTRLENKGELEFYLSDIMPCGVLVLAKEWAVLGTFPAHESYLESPMMEFTWASEAFPLLKEDWENRWTDASTKEPLKVSLGVASSARSIRP